MLTVERWQELRMWTGNVCNVLYCCGPHVVGLASRTILVRLNMLNGGGPRRDGSIIWGVYCMKRVVTLPLRLWCGLSCMTHAILWQCGSRRQRGDRLATVAALRLRLHGCDRRSASAIVQYSPSGRGCATAALAAPLCCCVCRAGASASGRRVTWQWGLRPRAEALGSGWRPLAGERSQGEGPGCTVICKHQNSKRSVRSSLFGARRTQDEGVESLRHRQSRQSTFGIRDSGCLLIRYT
eukprot:6161926-Prymnesium_polylepis.1